MNYEIEKISASNIKKGSPIFDDFRRLTEPSSLKAANDAYKT
jgi:hypothetical protein